MIQEITFNSFCDAFPESRQDSFTYEGKRALFDYLNSYEEDTGQKVELDIVALCCEYNEYDNLSDYLKDYSTDIEQEDFKDEGVLDVEEYDKAVLEEIRNKTTLIEKEGSSGFIIQAY